MTMHKVVTAIIEISNLRSVKPTSPAIWNKGIEW